MDNNSSALLEDRVSVDLKRFVSGAKVNVCKIAVDYDSLQSPCSTLKKNVFFKTRNRRESSACCVAMKLNVTGKDILISESNAEIS